MSSCAKLCGDFISVLLLHYKKIVCGIVERRQREHIIMADITPKTTMKKDSKARRPTAKANARKKHCKSSAPTTSSCSLQAMAVGGGDQLEPVPWADIIAKSALCEQAKAELQDNIMGSLDAAGAEDEKTMPDLEETEEEDDEPMLPCLITPSDLDSDDDDDPQWTADDLLNPDAPPSDVICHLLATHRWALCISRDAYCKATGMTHEEFTKMTVDLPLVLVTNIAVFLGLPAYIERGFIAGVKAVRNKNKRYRKLKLHKSFCSEFKYEGDNCWFDILLSEKRITLCHSYER